MDLATNEEVQYMLKDNATAGLVMRVMPVIYALPATSLSACNVSERTTVFRATHFPHLLQG